MRPAEEMITSSQGKEVGVVIKAGSLKKVVFQLHLEVWKGFWWAMRGRSGYPKQEEQFRKMVWEEGTEHSADEWRLAQLRAPGRDSSHCSCDRA